MHIIILCYVLVKNENYIIEYRHGIHREFSRLLYNFSFMYDYKFIKYKTTIHFKTLYQVEVKTIDKTM